MWPIRTGVLLYIVTRALSHCFTANFVIILLSWLNRSESDIAGTMKDTTNDAAI